jgi:hypothetical protein
MMPISGGNNNVRARSSGRCGEDAVVSAIIYPAEVVAPTVVDPSMPSML